MKTLKDLREDAKMTQVEVAVAVGVSLGAYRLWESRAGKPRDGNLNVLAKVLGDTVYKIF